MTYELPTVTAPPTNLAGADASTSAINLSWTAPSTASASIPAVTGYRVQSSDFAYANSSLPTGRTADSDTYGALTGDVDMVNANLYLSMNGTQQFGTDNGIGSSADGTNNGATTGVTGKLSNAWDFDGTNDWVDLGTGLNSYRITHSVSESAEPKSSDVDVFDPFGFELKFNTLLETLLFVC